MRNGAWCVVIALTVVIASCKKSETEQQPGESPGMPSYDEIQSAGEDEADEEDKPLVVVSIVELKKHGSGKIAAVVKLSNESEFPVKSLSTVGKFYGEGNVQVDSCVVNFANVGTGDSVAVPCVSNLKLKLPKVSRFDISPLGGPDFDTGKRRRILPDVKLNAVWQR